MSTKLRLTLLLLFITVALIMVLTIGRQWQTSGQTQANRIPPDLSAQNVWIREPGQPLSPFQLTDARGQPFGPEQLQGHWTFAFVGYTFCPDICPTTLAVLRDTLTRLDAGLPKPQVLLVSADPARDTPARLAEYLSFFDPAFLGVTGELAALEAFARDLNAVFLQRLDGKGVMLVDHSTHLALIDPQGQLRALLQQPLQPDAIAAAYVQIVRWYQANSGP